MRLTVECYAGRKGDERPVRFTVGEQVYILAEQVEPWYGPDDDFFRVRAEDGNLYVLRRRRPADEWTLESIRRAST